MKRLISFRRLEFDSSQAVRYVLDSWAELNLQSFIKQALPSKGVGFLSEELRLARQSDFSFSVGLSTAGAVKNALQKESTRARFDSWREVSLREALREVL